MENSIKSSFWIKRNINLATPEEPISSMVLVTPELAKYILENHNSNNRPVTQNRVNIYADQMLTGRWRTTLENLIFDTNGALAQGQHRLLAIVTTNMPANLYVSFGQLPESFAVLDTGRPRTASDAVAIGGQKNSRSMAAVVRLLIHHQRSTSMANNHVSNEDVTDFIINNPLVVGATTHGDRLRTALKCPVAGVGSACFLIATESRFKSQLDTFIEALSTGENLSKNDPILLLRDDIIQKRLGKGFYTISKSAVQAATTVLTWNKFVRGKTGGSRWTPDGELPKPI